MLVSVCMITYNHAKFVRQAIESILNQDTDFTYELVISDDNSSDDTASIIRSVVKENPHGYRVVFFDQPINLGMSKNFMFALEQCKGDYIAVCEGDDYWIDKYKLQTQLKFLKANNKYSICWTRYKTLESNNNIAKDNVFENVYFKNGVSHDITLMNMFEPYITLLLTSMFKSEILIDLQRFKYFKDNTVYALALGKGFGVVLDCYTAVYRVHNGGIWSSASLIDQLENDYHNFNEIYYTTGGKINHIKRWRNIKLNKAIFHAYRLENQSGKFFSLLRLSWATSPLWQKIKDTRNYIIYTKRIKK